MQVVFAVAYCMHDWFAVFMYIESVNSVSVTSPILTPFGPSWWFPAYFRQVSYKIMININTEFFSDIARSHCVCLSSAFRMNHLTGWTWITERESGGDVEWNCTRVEYTELDDIVRGRSLIEAWWIDLISSNWAVGLTPVYRTSSLSAVLLSHRLTRFLKSHSKQRLKFDRGVKNRFPRDRHAVEWLKVCIPL